MMSNSDVSNYTRSIYTNGKVLCHWDQHRQYTIESFIRIGVENPVAVYEQLLSEDADA